MQSGGSMSKEKIVREYEAWENWLEENFSLTLAGQLDENRQGMLIDLLRHFHLSGGCASNVYGDGALLVVDSDQNLFEQVERMVDFNIRNLAIENYEGKTPEGKQQLLVGRFDFASNPNDLLVGLEDGTKKNEILKAARKICERMTVEEVEEQLNTFDRNFLLDEPPEIVAKNIYISWRCDVDHNVKAELHESSKGEICVAMANRRSSPTGFFRNLLKVCYFHGFSLSGVRTLYVPQDHSDSKMVSQFKLIPPKKSKVQFDTLIGRFLESLAVTQWFEFDNPPNRRYVDREFSLHHTILLRSIEEFVFQMLVHVDEHIYTPYMINEALMRHPEISRSLVSLFSTRFNPAHHLSDQAIEKKAQSILEQIDSLDSGIPANDRRRRVILSLCLSFLLHIQKTNYYVLRRSGLSFRVNPTILEEVPFPDRKSLFPELPFAIYYVKGKNCISFNIRFRDLSRGGVRTLLPLDQERRELQHREVFRECYNLAYTQQKKNKDIPEGGSKSVIFVKLETSLERDLASERQVLNRLCPSKEALGKALEDHRHTAMSRQLFDAQKAFCDSLLDILIWDPKKNQLQQDVIRDLYGKEELVFLGPDENMLNQMIDWISSRSEARGYSVGKAFMSGKKELGINHKAFGVTSLGVHEYLKACLESRGLNSKGGFSAKIAGGPDGDVAGNELMNLVKDYGKKARILCIQDGTGVVYDPSGIHQGEITRLFKSGQGVAHMAPAKLGEGAFLLKVHERREISPGTQEILCLEGKKGKGGLKTTETWLGASEANRRYSRFLLSLPSDVFLPCGGRPRTLNGTNVELFCDEDGNPSSSLIVEGANLFLDESARKQLEEKGVLIIKDASANKCGVICSSYEIMAGLVTKGNEFPEIKDVLVEQVLAKLVKKARAEASLLVRASEGESVIELSDEVSRAINRWTDQIRVDLPKLREKGLWPKIFKSVTKEIVPEVLYENFGNRLKKLPQLYLDALVASAMASALVYRYGVNYEPSLVDSLLSEIKAGLFED